VNLFYTVRLENFFILDFFFPSEADEPSSKL